MTKQGTYWGEIRKASELGIKLKRDYKYVWSKCHKCGNGKWQNTSMGTFDDGITSKTMCHACAATARTNTRFPIQRSRHKRKGYRVISVRPHDPYYCMTNDNKKHEVVEHRYVMAKHLGRPLTKEESVHHKNGIRHDNRIENLELWSKQHPSGQRVRDLLIHYLSEMTQEAALDVLLDAGHFTASVS